jgi:hypothetical protein
VWRVSVRFRCDRRPISEASVKRKKHLFFPMSWSTSRLGRNDTYQWVLRRYNISRKHDIVAIWKESRRHGGSEGRNAQFVYRTRSVRHLQKLAVFVCVECVYLNVCVSRCLCLAVFDYFSRLLSRLNVADRIAQSYSNQSSHSLGARGSEAARRDEEGGRGTFRWKRFPFTFAFRHFVCKTLLFQRETR